ncbi:hypothetical protein DFH06DRAFT_1353661 [Mycena polygramma]|nr:hypothetical protein DFH06DRAFT_1353661 [Mycena polygramma]
MASPISSLPRHLLRRIFVEYHGENESVVLPSPAVDTPLCISLVSEEWRAVAHATPRLWTRYTVIEQGGSHGSFRSKAAQLCPMIYRAGLNTRISVSASRHLREFLLPVIIQHPKAASLIATYSPASDSAEAGTEYYEVFVMQFEPRTTSTWRPGLNRLVLKVDVERSQDWPCTLLTRMHDMWTMLPPHLIEITATNIWVKRKLLKRVLRECPLLQTCAVSLDVDETRDEAARNPPFVHHFLRRLSLGFTALNFDVLNFKAPNLAELSIGVIWWNELKSDVGGVMNEACRKQLISFIAPLFSLTSLTLHFNFSHQFEWLGELIKHLTRLQELTLRWHIAPVAVIGSKFHRALKAMIYQPNSDVFPLLHTLRIDLTRSTLNVILSRLQPKPTLGPRRREFVLPGALSARTYLDKVTLYVDPKSSYPELCSSELGEIKKRGVRLQIENMEPFGRDASFD